jgi:hypothetical protein
MIMRVTRTELLAALSRAMPGLSKRETLEQSNCFVFQGDRIRTFNDQIAISTPSPVEMDAVVSYDLIDLLEKLPDAEVDVTTTESEVLVKGKKRSAGIARQTELLLPLDAIPVPEGWATLKDGVSHTLHQASQVCGNDPFEPLTTVVHIGKARIEGCDNYRYLRADGKTGFGGSLLIPAASLDAVWSLHPFKQMATDNGWALLRTEDGTEIAMRCVEGEYFKDLDGLLNVEDGEDVTLPSSLHEAVQRSIVMCESGHDAVIEIAIARGVLKLLARKEGGWFRERMKVKYSGRPIRFSTNPNLITDLLARTRKVVVGSKQMKITVDNTQFVIGLMAEKGED